MLTAGGGLPLPSVIHVTLDPVGKPYPFASLTERLGYHAVHARNLIFALELRPLLTSFVILRFAGPIATSATLNPYPQIVLPSRRNENSFSAVLLNGRLEHRKLWFAYRCLSRKAGTARRAQFHLKIAQVWALRGVPNMGQKKHG